MLVMSKGPKQVEVLSLRLTSEEMARLDKLRDGTSLNRSDLVRAMLLPYVMRGALPESGQIVEMTLAELARLRDSCVSEMSKQVDTLLAQIMSNAKLSNG